MDRPPVSSAQTDPNTRLDPHIYLGLIWVGFLNQKNIYIYIFFQNIFLKKKLVPHYALCYTRVTQMCHSCYLFKF